MGGTRQYTLLFIVTLLALIVGLGVTPQRVGATAYACTEAGLDAAIAMGGSATFTCTAATTVTTANTKLVSANLTLDGGGLLTISGGLSHHVFVVSSGKTFAVQNLTIANGYDPNNNGAGIDNEGGTVTLDNSTLSGNTTDVNLGHSSGGGLYNNGGTIRITNSTLINNGAAIAGAGIYNLNGTIVIVNSTIAGNHAYYYGGGIDLNGGVVTLINDTLSGNQTTTGGGGGGINNAGTLNLTNSLVVNSSNGDLTDNAPVVNSHNLTGAFTFADGNTTTPGNHGGPTATFALPLGSAAIDAAVCAPTYTDPVTSATVTVTTDQRGVSRPQGNGCDIGAFERGATFFFAKTGDGQTATIGQPFALPLSVSDGNDTGGATSGLPVTFTAPTSGASGTFAGGATSVTVTTNASGVATPPTFTANAVVGSYAVTATGGGNTTTFTLTNTAGAAASIAIISGDHQSATIGSAFAALLHVRVLDANGNPVPGATVSFSAPTGNAPSASFSSGTATTTASGDASVTATAGGRPGVFTITATVNGVSTAFTLTDTAAPTTLTLTGFSPPSGPLSGGTTVTIHGTNFASPASVTFGGVAATGVMVTNSTTITAITPAATNAGTVDIVVTSGGQTATLHGYTYLPGTGGVSVQPGSHPIAGGGSVGGNAAPQPESHAASGGSDVQSRAAGAPPATPSAQPGRH